MPNVYIPQVPSRYDPLDGRLAPTVNLADATQYGDLVQLTQARNYISPEAIPSVIEEIHDSIGEITEDDYVMALGDPVLIAAAIAYACDTAGRANVLRWDRRNTAYKLIEVIL